jgi:hypothetical protein
VKASPKFYSSKKSKDVIVIYYLSSINVKYLFTTSIEMTRKLIVLAALFLSFVPFCDNLQAQHSKSIAQLRKKAENETKCFLKFVDAKKGAAIINAHVSIERFGDFTTDSLGKVYIHKPVGGKYSFSFTKDGYVSAQYEFEIIGSTAVANHFSVCPLSTSNIIYFVLDWEKSPADLDLHLLKTNGYHVNFRNPKIVSGEVALLVKDDFHGYGPETITLSRLDNNAVYYCYVHDFSHQYSKRSLTLSYSRAVVRVYVNNELAYSYKVPPLHAGNKWTVFQIKKGVFNVMNKFTDSM